MPHLLLASIPSDLLEISIPLSEKVIRTVAVYLGLLVLLRLAGKRDLAQLNTFDLVVLLLLSNVVQNAIIGPDNSLLGGLVGAFVLLTANAAMVRLARRYEPVAHLIEGTATTLATDGSLDMAALDHLGLRRADVIVALRHQGATSVDDVADATLEPGGSIVLRLKPQASPATKADVQRLEAKLDQLVAAQA